MNDEQINARINNLAGNFATQLANMEIKKSFLEIELKEAQEHIQQLEEAAGKAE